MPTYITAADVRIASGAPESLISDADINEVIDLVEPEVERWLNSKFTPTEIIEKYDGSGTEVLMLNQKPVLAVRALKTDESTVSPEYVQVYKNSGKIVLKTTAEETRFIRDVRDDKKVIIKYLYAWMKESSTKTLSIADASIGTSVAISVTAGEGADFEVDDWVEVYGMDGTREAAQVTAQDDDSVTVDQLVHDHESGSIVVKLEIPPEIKRYMEIEAAIAVAINAIGATYTFNASYSLGELSVVKGVPYVHWEASTRKLIIEREFRKERLGPMPSIKVM